MKHQNQGQVALQKLAAGQPVRRVAEAIGHGVNHVAIWRWLKGYSTPDARHRVILEREQGISVGAWDEEVRP